MAWELSGNAGTNPAVEFLGTTDNQPLIIKANGAEQLRITPNGNVGVGATGPSTKLEVEGQTYINNVSSTSANQLSFNEHGANWGHFYGDSNNRLNFGASNALNTVPASSIMTWDLSTGYVGIGTTNPSNALTVVADDDGHGISLIGFATGGPQGRPRDVGITFVDDTVHHGHLGLACAPNAFMMGIAPGDMLVNATTGILHLGAGDAFQTPALHVMQGGNVGIGTTAAGARLEVWGGGYGITAQGSDIGVLARNTTTPYNRAFLGTAGLAANFYGTVHCNDNVEVDGDVILTGADCAEDFDVIDAGETVPGTVVVLDQDGVLHRSEEPYDPKVAGVVSGAGDYKSGMILDRQVVCDGRAPLALVGKVYCKVDAQYAAIAAGDLLVTSSTPGHAMKASDPMRAFGAVIGKALRSLQAGQAMIPILVALQ